MSEVEPASPEAPAQRGPLHRRQFVLGPESFVAASGWKTQRLGAAGVLSHCPELSVSARADAEGRVWQLLGLAVQTDPERPDPLAEIGASRSLEVAERSRSWAGRWLLLGQDGVLADASALLGVFYRLSRAGTWASSSAALLHRILENAAGELDARELAWGCGVEWAPPPRSRFAQLRRLLPSQRLFSAQLQVRPAPLLPPEHEPLGYPELLDRLERSLLTALARMPKVDGTLWLPLTAGFDSRLLLAAARRGGLSLRTYTQRIPEMAAADAALPPQLAQAAGVPHQWIDAEAGSPVDLALHDAHTGAHTFDIDRRFIADGQWRFAGPQDLVLRGGCFEVGRGYYWKSFAARSPRHAPPPAEAIARGLGEPVGSSAVDGLREWVEWAEAHPHPGLDWRDRLYIEQRLAGWLSSIEQALDLVDPVRFHAINCSRSFGWLLSLPEDVRLASQHHVDLIHRMAPDLLRFPFNPGDRRGPRAIARRIARRVAARLRR